MLKKHIDSPGNECHQEGGGNSSAQLNYISTSLPSCILSFKCTSVDQQYFDFVVIKKQNNILQSYPQDTTDTNRIGEIRINGDLLRNTCDLWMLKVKYFGKTNKINTQGGKDVFVVNKTNVFYLDTLSNRHNPILHMHTTIKPHVCNLSNPIVSNEEYVQFIDF